MIQVIEKYKIFGANVLREYHNLKQISKENGIKIEIIYLPPYSPNPNLIERLWKYSKNEILQVYYEERNSNQG
jgi:transposase